MLSLAAVFTLFLHEPQPERVLVLEADDIAICEISRIPCTLADVEALRLCPGEPVSFSVISRRHAALVRLRRHFVPQLIHHTAGLS